MLAIVVVVIAIIIIILIIIINVWRNFHTPYFHFNGRYGEGMLAVP